METDRIFAHLQHESAEILTGIREWRTAHPTATFAEIQAAVDERFDRLRATVLQEIALASAAADGAERATTERPVCSACRERMAPRGTRERTLTVQGDKAVTLTRSYWGCPACGAGLFPPG
ncbi:MAG: YgiT-type zinc finger protein [Chloroflexota bacterium]